MLRQDGQESLRLHIESCSKGNRAMPLQSNCLRPLQTGAMFQKTKPYTWMVSRPTPENARPIWLGTVEKTMVPSHRSPHMSPSIPHPLWAGELCNCARHFFDMFCAFLYNVVRVMHPLLPALRRAYQLRINRFIGEIFPSGDYRGKFVWRTTVDTLSSQPY